MTDTALAEFVAQLDYKKMTKKQIANEKRWFTTQQKMERKHEMKKTVMGWFLTDPEAKYYVGVATGAGVALAGTVLGDIMDEVDGILDPDRTAALPKPGEGGPWWGWLVDPYGSIIREVGDPLGQWPDGKGGPLVGGDFATNLSDLLALGGGSFAAWCGSVIILRSIFSGTDLGEMMEGFGALIPFT